MIKAKNIILRGLGKQGKFHLQQMKEYGTKFQAIVNPGKSGEFEGIPIFETSDEAKKNFPDIDTSIIFVPAQFAKQAALEDLENNLDIILITEHIPIHDTLEILNMAKRKNLVVIGPNTPGIVKVDEYKLSIIPNLFKKGNISIVSRSGTLTYEIVSILTKNNLGQNYIVGIGGDPLIGTNFVDWLKFFEKDKETEKIILIGEIGGNLEKKSAEYIKKMKKPVFAYIAGITAPIGKRMGHAGAIIYGKTGTAQSKISALEKAGVKVAKIPSEILKLIK